MRDRPLVEAALLHHPPLAEHVAVVAREDDDRVLRLPGPLERVEQLAELAVDVGDEAVVGAAQRRQVLDRVEVDRVRLVGLVRPAVHRRVRDVRRVAGHLDLGALVEVPELLRHLERVVWVVVGGDEQERLLGLRPAALAQELERAEVRLSS